MFLKCIKDSVDIKKGKIYEGVKVNGVGNVLIGYYLYCIGVVGGELLEETDYRDAIVVTNNEWLPKGSRCRAIKIHDPLTGRNVWKIEGLDEEYAENILEYYKDEVAVDDRALFIDMINNMKNGERYTCGDWHVEKIGEIYKFKSPTGVWIDVSASTMWRKEEVDTVNFIDAYKHLEDGGSAVSVLSGARYSFDDIDNNDYQEIGIDEIKNKWILVQEVMI